MRPSKWVPLPRSARACVCVCVYVRERGSGATIAKYKSKSRPPSFLLSFRPRFTLAPLSSSFVYSATHSSPTFSRPALAADNVSSLSWWPARAVFILAREPFSASFSLLRTSYPFMPLSSRASVFRFNSPYAGRAALLYPHCAALDFMRVQVVPTGIMNED